MSAKGYKITEASQIVDLSRATVYKYLNEFQTIFKDSIRDVDGVRYLDDEGLYLLKKIKALKVHKNISLNDIETELLKDKYGQCYTDNNGIDNGIDTKSLKIENALLKEQNEALVEDIRFLREQQQELIKTNQQQNLIIAQLTQQNQHLLEDMRHRSIWRRLKAVFAPANAGV